MARRATAWITEEQKFAGRYVLQPAADMRYQGQSFEIDVPLQLDWIEAGDWAVWNLNLPQGGTYTVEYRVASLNGGGSLQLEMAGGAPVYGALGVPSTGGWQNWTTVSHRVTLPAGQQQIAVKANGPGWNLRYVKITKS